MLSCSWSLNQLCFYWSIWHPGIFGGDGHPWRWLSHNPRYHTRLNSWLKLIQIMLMFKEGFSIVQGRLLSNYVKVKGGFFVSVLYYLYLHSFVKCKQTNQQAGFLDLSLLCSGTRTQLMKLKEIICAKCFQQCTRQQIGPDNTFFK